MLIRQKAGWRLHHQAYLWPKKNRSPVLLASTSTRPGRSGGAAKNTDKNSVLSSSSSSSSLPGRRRRSNSNSLSTGEISPVLTWPIPSARNRQGSEGSCDSSYTSSTSSSELSSRKRSLSSSADQDEDDLQSQGTSARTSWGCFNSSMFHQESTSQAHHYKRTKRSSASVSCSDDLSGSVGGLTASSRGDKSDGSTDDGNDVKDATKTCNQRSELCNSSTRTLRDTRKRASKGANPVVPICNLTSYSTFKGSNNNVYGNISGSSIIIPYTGSAQTSSSSKESIRENNCRNNNVTFSGDVSKNGEMGSKNGEMGSKKENRQKNGSCEVIHTSVFFRSKLPSFCQSLCEDTMKDSYIVKKIAHTSSKCNPDLSKSSYNLDYSDSSYNLDDSRSSYNLDDSRSSYNLDDSGPSYNIENSDSETFQALDNSGSFYNYDYTSDIAMTSQRTQRTSSAKPVNEIIKERFAEEKMTQDAHKRLNQNGLKFKSTVMLENLKIINERRNQTSCSIISEKNERVTSHNFVLSTSTSPIISSSASTAPSSNNELHSNVTTNSSNMQINSMTRLPHQATVFCPSGCGRTQPAASKDNSAMKTQPHVLTLSLLSLSSSASSTTSASQQLFNPSSTQGSESPNAGSTNSSNDFDPNVDSNISTSVSTIKTVNSVTLNLRHKKTPGNNPQTHLSQPASLPLSKPEPLLIIPSSPSLSPLINGHPMSTQSPGVPCRWRGCSSELDASDLLEHIRKHAEAQIEKKSYACFWGECKVFNKPSWSYSWLERHIVSHSGHRPFKCILDNCGQRFHSQAVLERHVNGHFTTASSQTGIRSTRGRDDVNHRMIDKRKRQLKCRISQIVKMNDIFDEQTMAVIKQELQSLAGYSQPDITGIALHITFRGLIVGRRLLESGPKQSLVEFTPSDMLEDKWVMEDEAEQMFEITIPLSGLPGNSNSNLHNRLYRRHRFRKHRRK